MSKCIAITKKGTQCTRKAKVNQYCTQHYSLLNKSFKICNPSSQNKNNPSPQNKNNPSPQNKNNPSPQDGNNHFKINKSLFTISSNNSSLSIQPSNNNYDKTFKNYFDFIHSHKKFPNANFPNLWKLQIKIIKSEKGLSRGLNKKYLSLYQNIYRNILFHLIDKYNLYDDWKHLMLYKYSRKCVICSKNSLYNYPYWEKWAAYCNQHRKEKMVNVRYRKCEEIGCNKQPNFNYENESRGLYCKEHRKENMVNVLSRKCEEEYCNKQPSFNYENESRGLYCGDHRKENMVDVRDRKCEEKNCNKQPNFNYENKSCGLYCKEHRKENMVDVRHRKCEEIGCAKIPNFNYVNESRGRYCNKHRKENMIDVRHPKCQENNCNKRPNFNYVNKSRGLYCSKHRKENMIDVKNQKCQENNCTKQPYYNYENESRGRYCNQHRKENMIDVINPKCEEKGCNTRASYGNIQKPKKYCFRHAKKYKAIKIQRCENERCRKIAMYNEKNIHPALRCEYHAKENDIHLFEESCVRCKLPMLLNEQRLCDYCKIPMKRYETKVVDSLKEKYGDIFEQNDKIIPEGCSRKRPDVILNGGTYKIIVEVDEYQHQSYERECELVRMFQIHQDLSGYDVIFIRFNPDSYRVDGKRKNPRLNTRLSELKKYIDVVLRTYGDKLEGSIRICYMYYDEYDGKPQSQEMSYEEIGLKY